MYVTGHLVEGLAFHKHYFDISKGGHGPYRGQQLIFRPVVRFIGENGALICYNRIVQDELNVKITEETRIWERKNKDSPWKHIHFHRSNPSE